MSTSQDRLRQSHSGGIGDERDMEKAGGERRTEEEAVDTTMDYPEGGCRAWATASGTSIVMLCTLGYVNSYG